MPRALKWLGILTLVGLIAGEAQAQEPSGIRKAGNEIRFRVIPRFDTGGASDTAVRLLELIQSKQYNAAFAELKKKPYKGPHGAFLEGFLLHRSGDHAEAAKTLSTHAAGLGVLEEYAWFYAAKSAQELGSSADAALYASRVRENPLLRPEAIWIMANALNKLAKPTEATRAYRGLVTSYPRSSQARQARLLIATQYETAGRWDDAAREWMKVRETAPLSADGRTAVAQLAKYQNKLSKTVRLEALVGPAVVLQEYRARFGKHQSKRVVDELSALSKSWKKGSVHWCEAQYLIAKSYSKLRKHDDSLAWYSRVVSTCNAHQSLRRKALYNGGKGRWNAKKKDGALAWFKLLRTDYPEHSYADDAYYFAARIRQEQNKNEAARALLEAQLKRYPTGDMASDAHWMLVRRLFETGKYKAIVSYVDSHESAENDLYSKGRMLYFKARAIALGKLGDPRSAYARTASEAPMSYYALLALNRIRVLEGVKDLCAERPKYCSFATAGRTIPPITSKIAESGAFKRGFALVELHLGDLARRELKRVRPLATGPDELWSIADLLDRAGAYPLSHDIPRREIKTWEVAYPDPKGTRTWDIAYPMPFETTLSHWSAKRKLPAALPYAIIREESGFSPGIESWANARGLMQLMEGTGKRMAKDDGLSRFKANDLFTPTVAVRLGTRYLWELGERFEQHPALIIAGYNGGARNVTTWLKRSPTLELDLFVEDIPYGQTRNYTKRVLRTFWVYAYMSGQRVPRIEFGLPSIK